MGKPNLSKIIFLLSFFLFVCTVTLLAIKSFFPQLLPFNFSFLTSNKKLSPITYPLKSQSTVIHTVHDGDTVYSADFKAGIRLIGINAPEMANSYTNCKNGQDEKCLKGECGAIEAKEKLKSLVFGKEVVLVEDKLDKVDAYGRLLRYLYICPMGLIGHMGQINESDLQSCQDINLEMVASGFAEENAYRKHFEKEKEYVEAEKIAKENKLGNWKICEK